MIDLLGADDHAYLNEYFKSVGYSIDLRQVPCPLAKDEYGPVGVFGDLLVNLAVDRSVLLHKGVLGDVELSQLKRMPSLDFLHVLGPRFHADESMEQLAHWYDGPKNLYFTLAGVTDRGLSAISQMKHLEILYFEHCNHFTDVGASHIGKITGLKSLTIKHCSNLTNNAWSFLSELSRLEDVYFFQPHISNELAEYLGTIPSLLQVQLQRSRESTLNDTGMSHLGNLKALSMLELRGFPDISDIGLKNIAHCLDLKLIVIDECTGIGDGGFVSFAGLHKLEKFEFTSSPSIDGSGLKHLGSAGNLATLNLYSCTNLTDTGVFQLPNLEQLRELCLCDCEKLTDTVLERLSVLKNLRELNVYGCDQMTRYAMKRLRNSCPQLQIYGPPSLLEE